MLARGGNEPVPIGNIRGGSAANIGGVGGGGNDGGNQFGGGGSMGPWETSVEKRLDSLDRRLTSIETDVSQVRVDVGSIKTDLTHRPTHLWMFSAIALAVTIITGATALIEHYVN